MKKAFIIGHHLYSQGAFSPELKETEYYFNSKVGEYLKKMGNDIFYHDQSIASYEKRCKLMANKIKSYDLAFELHYNFFNLTSANGTEAVCWNGNKAGEILAKNYIEKISAEFGTKKRSILNAYKEEKDKNGVIQKVKHRGYWMLYYPKPTTLLLEPFFGSNIEDTKKFKQNHEKYAILLNELF